MRFFATHRTHLFLNSFFLGGGGGGRVPWSQRLSFIRSFLFGSLRREALIEVPSPREKKTSGQER